MKRIAIFGLVVCLFLLLGNIFARGVKLIRDQGGKSTKWMQVQGKQGVYFQQLWSDDEWPQVAVLKLSDDAYEEFRKNPAKFINVNHIFPDMVQDPAGPGVSLTAPKEPGGFWFVLVSHGHPSKTYSAAVPEPLEK
jgi:hypothetical protein